jgi:hypothetical protein
MIFDRQPINVRDRRFELLSGITAIGIKSGVWDTRRRIARSDRAPRRGPEHRRRAPRFEHVAECVRYDMPPFDFA